jgi:hypothetical protein
VLLVGEVAHHPADAIHWHQASDGILFSDTLQATNEFTAGKAQLGDE